MRFTFRLSDKDTSVALATGGTSIETLGKHWMQFTLFRADWPQVDTRFWARAVYRHAMATPAE